MFLLAGVVYCNTHALDLNQIRGYGRGKPLLHSLFLCGACSLAGIPGFLGYISKTLVHESLVELAAESGSLGVTAVEWLFLFSGGLTAAYLTKIYVALFWQKPISPTGKTWGTPMTVTALVLAALPLPVLGLLPHGLAEPVAALAGEVIDQTEKANSIFPKGEPNMGLRKGHLLEARAALMALDVRLGHCYTILALNPQGCFTKPDGKSIPAAEATKKLDNMAQSLGEKIDRENELIRAVLESDRKRK